MILIIYISFIAKKSDPPDPPWWKCSKPGTASNSACHPKAVEDPRTATTSARHPETVGESGTATTSARHHVTVRNSRTDTASASFPMTVGNVGTAHYPVTLCDYYSESTTNVKQSVYSLYKLFGPTL